MKQAALQKSEHRLFQAAQHLEALRRVVQQVQQPNPEMFQIANTFDAAWEGLLTALNSIFEVLKKGASGDLKSSAWMEARKKEVFSDPLLLYVRRARNTEYHGWDRAGQLALGSMTVGSMPAGYATVSMEDGGTQQVPVIHLSGGSWPQVGQQLKLHFTLTAVPGDDRIKPDQEPAWTPVPEQHMGTWLPDQSPLTIGEAAFRYYEWLTREAGAFAR